jgi:hypothetical protein
MRLGGRCRRRIVAMILLNLTVPSRGTDRQKLRRSLK